jgi:CRISPR system Cascade subunit CasD
LGRKRSEPVDDLAKLRMGVRVDYEGSLKREYQTAGGTHLRGDTYGVIHADGRGHRTVESQRYYLADADFLVGLESQDDYILDLLYRALAQPIWQLFLGRKAFVPGIPVFIPEGYRLEIGLEQALKEFPWPRWDMELPNRPWDLLRLVLEVDQQTDVDTDTVELRMDQPFGTAYLDRQFHPRRIVTKFLAVGTDIPTHNQEE